MITYMILHTLYYFYSVKKKIPLTPSFSCLKGLAATGPQCPIELPSFNFSFFSFFFFPFYRCTYLPTLKLSLNECEAEQSMLDVGGQSNQVVFLTANPRRLKRFDNRCMTVFLTDNPRRLKRFDNRIDVVLGMTVFQTDNPRRLKRFLTGI